MIKVKKQSQENTLMKMKLKLTITSIGKIVGGLTLILLTACHSKKELSVQENNNKISFRAGTYNIRYDADADKKTGNGWEQRKEALAKLILQHRLELFGTQEGDVNQMVQLKELLPGYAYISKAYGGTGDLHTCSILYKKDLFEVMDQGVFWLSETPDVPSIGWDATDRRICQWAKMRDRKTGRTFFFFNAHFYWRYETAKRESGPLMAAKIKAIAGNSPVLCTGDFNSTAETSQIRAIKDVLQDAYQVSENGRKGYEDTNLGGGNFQGLPKGRIDYIFLSKNISAKNYEVYADQYGANRYPSDHLPVSCDVIF